MDLRRARYSLVGLCAVLGGPIAAHSVNLVPNYSFESYATCPTGFGQIAVATPWDTPNTGTSDAFNACAPVVFPSVNVPSNQQGTQSAQTGVGYAGIIPLSAAADYREYIQAPLSSPLTAGMPYLVQFYISLADLSSIAIDRLGAYLSVGPVGPVPNYAALPFTPQVESPPNAFLTDATNWMLISGIVIASGGENHIVIGNFHSDANTSTVAGPGNWPGGAYYYIEDVSVELVLPTEQACCLPDHSCSMQFPGECELLGGKPGGIGSTCSPNPCNPVASQDNNWGNVKSLYR